MLDEIANRVSANREMEALCRARGMHENAERWKGLAEAAQRDLDRAAIGRVDPDGLDEFGAQLWNAVETGAMLQGVCPCGVEGCRGLDWLLDGEEPY